MDIPYENYSKILGIQKVAKRSKIIYQFIQFLAQLTRVHVFHLVQCEL